LSTKLEKRNSIIRSIYFEYGDRRNIKYISVRKVFYEEKKCGPRVCLYKTESLIHHYSPGFGGSAPSGFSTENAYFYFKKVDEFDLIRRKEFAEQFSEYFSGCPSLKDRMQKGEVTHKDYSEIMRAYNWCK
jgi:hypothetical protein